MRSIRIGAAVAAIAATLVMPGGAAATQPEPVTITVETHVAGFEDTFVASGGLVCATGTVSNVGGPNVGGGFTGWQSGSHGQILLTKRFECPNGSFDVLLRATLDFATGDTVGTWSVIRGTGAYASLHGAGSLTGDRVEPMDPVIMDTYTGRVHLD